MRWLALFVLLIILAGCASYVPVGMLYTGGKMGVQANSGDAPKTGKACMVSVLGLVAGGDASIEAAKAAGGIKDVKVLLKGGSPPFSFFIHKDKYYFMIGLSVKRIGESIVIFGTEGVKEVGKGVKGIGESIKKIFE